MAFEKIVPRWDAVGSEPPASLKQSGFQPGYKPPADYFNWFWHSVSECLKELQEKAGETGLVTIGKGGTGATNVNDAAKNLFFRGYISQSNLLDANSLTEVGIYKVAITDSTIDPEEYNLPSKYGLLVIYNTLELNAYTYVVQEFYQADGLRRYHRTSSNKGTNWQDWAQSYSTANKPTPADIGAVASASEILSTTSITQVALNQANGTVKNYAFSGDSYAGGDLPSDGYKYGSATVFKRYGFAAVVLWGAPNATAIAIKYYNDTSKTWTDWCGSASADVVTATLSTTWTEQSDGSFAQTVSVDGVTADKEQAITVDCALSGTDIDADIAVLEAWGCVNRCDQSDGKLTFVCYGDTPTVAIPLNVVVM